MKLYYMPGTAAMAPHVALEEAGAAFELVKLDREKGEHNQPAYLAVNPKGVVPALVDGKLVITESAAIMLYLADKFPSQAPARGTPERAAYYEWLAYMNNTIQPAMLQFFYPQYFVDAEAARADLKQAAERRMAEKMWPLVDARLAKTPFLAGELSGADIFMTMLVRWSRTQAKPAWSFANVKRVADKVVARPAFQRMMTAQGITWPY